MSRTPPLPYCRHAGLTGLLLVVLGAGCSGSDVESLPGDPARGKVALRAHGCGSCHSIPGVPGANGRVGPPLEHLARQAYLAGVLPNSPENLALWIRDPEAVDPRTAMPDLGVSAEAAEDMAAYLYTLK